ncbi:hypothetical protein F2P56_019970 [Juglans regia]|uniref:Uncharacterized protein LOC108994288 isoform X1 n=2 Tax=Juglans regia TaxID=51240 RepID=A0A2I4F002_JUGRE|nr:uncharacterized protein LOC108994288 isoform X1 [Juglans regia]KAF5460073.1 hypothetical protein F2P56_019970 [Juglans regia]
MADWGPVIVAVLLFVLLSPGLLFQMPAKGRVVEFGNMQTSGASILVHAIIYFGLITIFVIAIGVHIYTGTKVNVVPWDWQKWKGIGLVVGWIDDVFAFKVNY